MTNKYYRYPGYELWNENSWGDRLESPIIPLVTWFGENTEPDTKAYDAPIPGYAPEELKNHPSYVKKTNSVVPPAAAEYWREKGMSFNCFSLGGVRWMMFYPSGCLADKRKKLKTVYTFDRIDYDDAYWMGKTLRRYDALCHAAAGQGGTMLFFMMQRGREAGPYVAEILQEASTRYPVDNDGMLLNCSVITEKGMKVSEIPGYVYRDANGGAADPDAAVSHFLGIPVLDISGRWAHRYSLNRKQILKDDYSNKNFDRERAIHSGMGERMMQGIALERDFDSFADEGLRDYYAAMGAIYQVSETKGERWISVAPRCAAETDEKLPLMVVFQEVGSGNEHLAITAQSYLYECNRLAAQGEFIALWFVLESPQDNDLLLEILEEVRQMYPVDERRIYIMGHSHNGLFTKEFARRHPKVPAGIITLGSNPGLVGVTGTAAGTDDTDEKVEAFHNEDVPNINLSGTCEHNYFFPVAGVDDTTRAEDHVALRLSADERIKALQRRLYAHNCPVKSAEEIIAAMESGEHAERKLGIPADKSYTIYLDNEEHYVCEIKNNEGRYHLCIVGIDNIPHVPTASMVDLAWSWIRRFARDRDSGKVIELT